jgi:hypothetical protein
VFGSDRGAPPLNEKEVFAEYVSSIFADDIKLLIGIKNDAGGYRNFIDAIFGAALNRDRTDPVWKLLDYLGNQTNFFSSPASTRYHGSEEYGLVRHSLLVLSRGLKLAPVMLCGEVDFYYLVISCLFHDLCKTDMYESKTRNQKNEETGNWEQIPYYKVKDTYISHGHGVESMLRLNKFISMPDPWNHAVRWHMGAYDISPMDKFAMEKIMRVFPEVLFLQTADMQAGIVDNT